MAMVAFMASQRRSEALAIGLLRPSPAVRMIALPTHIKKLECEVHTCLSVRAERP